MDRPKHFFSTLRHFFPIQLFLGYLKRDYLFIFVWLLLFLVVNGNTGTKFGLPYIFLSPEYLGHIGMASFLFAGIGVGSFIMAFNVSAYVISAHRYPFLATVSRPFLVFTLNNSIIPVLYILLYIYRSLSNQIYYELIPPHKAVINIVFFLIGISIFVGFAFLYFFLVNKLLPRIFRFDKDKLKKSKYFSWIVRIYQKDKERKLRQAPEENIGADKIELYFDRHFRIKYSRKFGHYDKSMLARTFTNQHIHAFFFAIIVLLLIFFRGLMNDKPAFIIPAVTSIHVIFTELLLVSSLFYIFFAEWSVFYFFVLVFVLSLVNPLYTEKYTYSAYGLNYNLKSKINPLEHGNYTKDSLEIIKVLNKWKQNYVEKYHTKPHFVAVSTSGGGMKQAVWTYYALSMADSITDGQLMESTRLMTGASGGMLGIAYLRENYRQQKMGLIKDFRDKKYLKLLSEDILNPVLYGLSMSDIFPHYKTFKFGKHRYIADRAYLFEQTFNRHTNNALEHSLAFYRRYEENAQIPMLILTPTIMNIGTRMIISPMDVSFLTKHEVKQHVRNIEFRYNYRRFDADSLNFLSAVRMNASFPYVTPFVTMPGKTKIRVFDAGLNDNYGFLTAYDFLLEFHKWIEANTKGVIFINICENEIVNYNDRSSAFYKLLEPIMSIFNDWDIIENSNYHSSVQSLQKIFPGRFHLIDLTFGTKKNLVSLSWHLTEREKQFIYSEIYNKQNQQELRKLQQLLLK